MKKLKSSNHKGRSKSAPKRRAIIEAAEELFLEQGLKSTPMDEIARLAGVSKQTVYSHFRSKELLFRTVVEERIKEYQLTEEIFQQDKSQRELLMTFTQRLFSLLVCEEAIFMARLCTSTVDEHPELAELFYEYGPKNTCQLLQDWLTSQVDAGKLDIDNTEFAAIQYCYAVKSEPFQRALWNLDAWTEEKTQDYLNNCVSSFLKAWSS